MTCPLHTKCNRARNVSACQDEAECLKMLKQWVLLGKQCADKDQHKAKWSDVEGMVEEGVLPSAEALDAEVITEV